MYLRKQHHIAIISSDWAKAKEFYIDKLGFELISESYRPAQDDYLRMLKQGDTILSQPATQQINYFTAGVGCNLGRSCFVDLAYCHADYTSTEYMLFYGCRYPAATSGEVAEIYESTRFQTTVTRHNFALTFGVRF